MMGRLVERVLVVEDDRSLLRTIERALRGRFPDVRGCRTVADVRKLVDGWRPDLVVLDYQLPDGDAEAILDLEALERPAPVVVAVSGEANPAEAFSLAQRGVRAYLSKPITLEELEQAIDVAVETAPSLERHVRQVVGHRGLNEVTDEVRETMIDEALAQTANSRRGAARILDVSRQLLQYLLRRS